MGQGRAHREVVMTIAVNIPDPRRGKSKEIAICVPDNRQMGTQRCLIEDLD
jgi:hypothetical protein